MRLPHSICLLGDGAARRRSSEAYRLVPSAAARLAGVSGIGGKARGRPGWLRDARLDHGRAFIANQHKQTNAVQTQCRQISERQTKGRAGGVFRGFVRGLREAIAGDVGDEATTHLRRLRRRWHARNPSHGRSCGRRPRPWRPRRRRGGATRHGGAQRHRPAEDTLRLHGLWRHRAVLRAALPRGAPLPLL